MKFSLSSTLQKTMNLVRRNNNSPKAIAERNRRALVKAGKQQFEKLRDMGLSIPVSLA